MRISDWSSDVCSSDLAWTRAAPGSSRTNARSAEASRIALLTRGFRAPLRDQLLRPQGLVVLGIAPDRVLHAADRTVDTEEAQLSILQMPHHLVAEERKGVAWGKSGSVSGNLGVRR